MRSIPFDVLEKQKNYIVTKNLSYRIIEEVTVVENIFRYHPHGFGTFVRDASGLDRIEIFGMVRKYSLVNVKRSKKYALVDRKSLNVYFVVKKYSRI